MCAPRAGKDDTDAKKSRAERFGLSIKENISEKKNKRAARFGMETNGLSASSSSASKSTSKAVAKVDDETKKKRMAKFGLSEEETAKLSGPARANTGSKAKPTKEVRTREDAENFFFPSFSPLLLESFFLIKNNNESVCVCGL